MTDSCQPDACFAGEKLFISWLFFADTKDDMESCMFTISKKTAVFLIFLTLRGLCAVAAQTSVTHVVAKDETLYSIGRKYGVSVNQICEANSISQNSIIRVGQKLSIPQAGQSKETTGGSAARPAQAPAASPAATASREYDVYTVQSGDTLYHIAKVNDISVAKLKSLNNLSDESRLLVGQKLKIPVTILDTDNADLPDLPSSDPRSYSSKKGDSSLTWPVQHPVVTYTTGKVSGVHLSAEKDEDVKSIRAGTVMYTGSYRGYGQVVFVQSKTGYIYAYSGLGSIKVKKGDYVVFGDTLGTAGTDSIKGTSQISLMVFLKSTPVDPAKAPRG